jgi:hypothetical protein
LAKTYKTNIKGRQMKRIRLFAFGFLVLGWTGLACGQEFIFEGPWKTTNRKLDGIMTCVVKQTGEEKWQGRFFGVWPGVPFDYTVPFSGPPEKLQGTATIDGASYTWTGEMNRASQPCFKGTFGGSRYTGNFELTEKPKKVAVR